MGYLHLYLGLSSTIRAVILGGCAGRIDIKSALNTEGDRSHHCGTIKLGIKRLIGQFSDNLKQELAPPLAIFRKG